jgi:hypothetical protein
LVIGVLTVPRKAPNGRQDRRLPGRLAAGDADQLWAPNRQAGALRAIRNR